MAMMTKSLIDAPAMTELAENDIQAARTFWRDTLGFTEVFYDEQGQEAAYKASQGTGFGIYQHEGGSKADHTQITFPVKDFDATFQALKQHGVKFEEYDLPGIKTVNGVATMPDGSKGAWFKDPGGNIIGVFQLNPEMQRAWMG